jgi:hypothetical protein
VETAFETYLGRSAPPTQVYGAVKAAQEEHTSVAAVLLGSREFFLESGGTLKSYVSGLETAVLGKTVSGSALTISLARGVAPYQVADELLESDIGQAALLTNTYETVLGRAPTSQELASGLSLMHRKVDLWQISASLLASPEFFSQFTTSS